jgi:hypothetical protein
VHLPQGAGPGGEVLGKGEHRPAVHPAETGDHPVRRDFHLFHAEIDAAVFDKNIGLPEGARVKEQVQALRAVSLPLLSCFSTAWGPPMALI